MDKLVVVPDFVEIDSVELSGGNCDIPVKKRAKNKVWKRIETFQSFEEADASVKKQNCWRQLYTHSTTEGKKIYFSCSKASVRNNCPVSMYMLLHCNNLKVSIYETEDDHENHALDTGIPKAIKDKIMELYDDGVRRPKAIVEALKLRKIPEPTIVQIKNFLAFQRRQKYGSATINVSDLQAWCTARMEVPTDIDQPYVVAYKVSVSDLDENEDLGLFVPSPRLLSLAKCSDLIQADATYKLNWQGYPVLLVGTSDLDRRFHPFGLAVCYGESEKDFEFVFRSLKMGVEKISNQSYLPKVLMADGSHAISNAFKGVFGDNSTRLMCYFHVVKNIDGRLRQLKDKQIRSKIKEDIQLLQLSISEPEFQFASSLFLKKWNENQTNGNEIEEFVSYFDRSWLKTYSNWFEGICSKYPSTNNGLEATNAVLKKEYTFRERLPLGQFLDLVENKIVKQWSQNRNPENVNHHKFVHEVSISLNLWTASYQWVKSKIKILSNEADSQINYYYIPSSKFVTTGEEISQLFVDEMKSQNLAWVSFDEYRNWRETIWTLNLEKTNWKLGSCNCPYFLKKNICKHQVGVAIRLGLITPPNEAKQIPLGQKRKRGRPSQSKAALVKQ